MSMKVVRFIEKGAPNKVWVNCVKENIDKQREHIIMTDDRDDWKRTQFTDPT